MNSSSRYGLWWVDAWIENEGEPLGAAVRLAGAETPKMGFALAGAFRDVCALTRGGGELVVLDRAGGLVGAPLPVLDPPGKEQPAPRRPRALVSAG